MDFAADQPVLLTAGDGNDNGATVRFLVDGAEPPPVGGYERVVFMFDGYDQAQLEGARAQWKTLERRGACADLLAAEPGRALGKEGLMCEQKGRAAASCTAFPFL